MKGEVIVIKDRGIKWQPAAFLPEHRLYLQAYESEQKKQPRQKLDEQKLEEMNQTICEAMEYNKLLSFIYYQSGKYEILIGKIHYCDGIKKELIIVDQFEDFFKISLTDIYDIRFT